MLIRLKRWEEVRHLFGEDERAELVKVQTGESICPAGIVIDEDRLTPELRLKIRTNFPAVMTAGRSIQG